MGILIFLDAFLYLILSTVKVTWRDDWLLYVLLLNSIAWDQIRLCSGLTAPPHHPISQVPLPLCPLPRGFPVDLLCIQGCSLFLVVFTSSCSEIGPFQSLWLLGAQLCDVSNNRNCQVPSRIAREGKGLCQSVEHPL